MQKLTPILFFSLSIFLLSACGYSLRGNEAATTSLSAIQLVLQQPNSELSRLLRQNLESAGVTVELAASPEQSKPSVLMLSVTDEQVASRPVTVNPRARAAQYELRMSVTIALGRDARYLIEPEPLVVQRVYFEDIENITGNREEVEIISAEMRRELVNQLMRRLAAAGA